MKTYFPFFLFLLSFFSPLVGSTFTEQDEQAFYEKLQDQLTLAEARVHEFLKRKGQNQTVLTHQNQIAIEHARQALTVKHMLYSNFFNTPSIESPEVRKNLLEIFQSDEITIDDLQNLQNAVFKWKQKNQGTP